MVPEYIVFISLLLFILRETSLLRALWVKANRERHPFFVVIIFSKHKFGKGNILLYILCTDKDFEGAFIVSKLIIGNVGKRPILFRIFSFLLSIKLINSFIGLSPICLSTSEVLEKFPVKKKLIREAKCDKLGIAKIINPPVLVTL